MMFLQLMPASTVVLPVAPDPGICVDHGRTLDVRMLHLCGACPQTTSGPC